MLFIPGIPGIPGIGIPYSGEDGVGDECEGRAKGERGGNGERRADSKDLTWRKAIEGWKEERTGMGIPGIIPGIIPGGGAAKFCCGGPGWPGWLGCCWCMVIVAKVGA